MAWTNYDKVARVYKLDGMGNKVHPTQKPLSLMRWCIENYTNPGDTILDPFMGSGTTGVAAIQTGRRFLGFEISPEYTRLANDRCDAARRGLTLSEHRNGQGSLFDE